MLSQTLSQGNSEASWNTTPRSGPGFSTGAPSNRRSPPERVSKPASRLSSVDLPQPDGPSRATNSPSPISSVMSSSARTGTLPGNVFDVARNEMAPIWSGLERLQAVPAEHPVLDRDDQPVAEESQQADRRHVGDHDVHAPDVVGVPQHVAEAGFDRDHFGDDDRRPADAEPDAQAGEDRGQRR